VHRAKYCTTKPTLSTPVATTAAAAATASGNDSGSGVEGGTSLNRSGSGGLCEPQVVAVAALRMFVEDEALSSLDALSASEELEPIATQLGRLVYGEFNLFAEGEALESFALTSIGRHPRFRVVGVIHHSPKCLVEEVAEGPTVAKALRLDNGVLPPTTDRAILELLQEYHVAVFNAFVQDGLIHSDIHLGNAVLELEPEPARGAGALAADTSAATHADGLGGCGSAPGNGGSDDGVHDAADAGDGLEGLHRHRHRFALFDVGQYANVDRAETVALLWTLSWISTPARHQSLRRVAIRHLQAVSSLNEAKGNRASTAGAIAPLSLAARIENAFDEAVAPDADGQHPDKKTAYMLFLRNAERNGVVLPRGAFALAKMIDGILSQQETYGLEPVVDKYAEGYLKSTLGFSDVYDLAMSYVSG
jgi:hypothetical protein